MKLETVKIKAKNDQGFIVINKDDLKKSDDLFAVKEVKKPVKKSK